jgi:hypothetical protein
MSFEVLQACALLRVKLACCCCRSAKVNSLYDSKQGVCIRDEECHAGVSGPHVWSAGCRGGRRNGVDV